MIIPWVGQYSFLHSPPWVVKGQNSENCGLPDAP